MVGSIVEGDLYIHDGIPGQSPFFHRLYDPFLHCRDVLSGDGAPHDLVHKFIPPTPRERLELDPAIAILTTAAGLLLIPPLNLGPPVDRLLVGDAGHLHMDLKPELPFEPIDRDLQVGLPHPCQDDLFGLRIAANPQRRVLLSEAVQPHAQLLLVPLCLRHDGIFDDGAWDLNGLKEDRAPLVAEGITRSCFLQLQHGSEITRANGWNRHLILAPKQNHLADPLLTPFGDIVHAGVG